MTYLPPARYIVWLRVLPYSSLGVNFTPSFLMCIPCGQLNTYMLYRAPDTRFIYEWVWVCYMLYHWKRGLLMSEFPEDYIIFDGWLATQIKSTAHHTDFLAK